MPEQLPYHQLQQLNNHLPLPDENMAWEDMKRRLDEDDDCPLLPWYKTGCLPWAIGLLLLVAIATAWWYSRHTQQQGNKATPAITVSNTQPVPAGTHTVKQNQVTTPTATTQAPNTNGIQQPDSLLANLQPKPHKADSHKQQVITNSATATAVVSKGNSKTNTFKTKKHNTPNIRLAQNRTTVVTAKKTIKPTPQTTRPTIKAGSAHNPQTAADTGFTALNIHTPQVITQPQTGNTTNNTFKKDSTALPRTDTLAKDTTTKKKPTADTLKPQKPQPPKATGNSPFSFQAGLGLYQLLPLSGQSAVPYSAAGRKGSLADYIPALYLRATKNNRWFIQAEYRYGAPQNNKAISYEVRQQKDKLPLDTANFSRYTYTLKRTFYHQVHLSFNYYVLPRLSVGTGIIWNRFISAVAQTEFIRGHEFFGLYDTTRTLTISRQTADSSSAFKKSYLQAQFSLQYQWRRWSIGGKYTMGLQPFIQYTLPGQPTRQEKNQAFLVYLQFRLWGSQPVQKKKGS